LMGPMTTGVLSYACRITVPERNRADHSGGGCSCKLAKTAVPTLSPTATLATAEGWIALRA
jgi:hypothetical protein